MKLLQRELKEMLIFIRLRFLQGGAFGERGYLVATMKEYTISDMGASTHFFISEALFGDWGGFAARAKEKHRFYRTDANLAES